LRRQPDVLRVVAELNRVLIESQGDSRFVTAVCGVLDPGSGRFEYVKCGHNPPLLLGPGGRREPLERGGAALGLLPELAFVAGSVTLGAGELLALYTDGVVEPSDAQESEFGIGRLEDLLRRGADLPASVAVQSVVDATRSFSGRDDFSDDFTLVVLKRNLVPAPDGRAGAC
jgi:sigma-B regulation protein RsbU (phosphoserine phosphatase)